MMEEVVVENYHLIKKQSMKDVRNPYEDRGLIQYKIFEKSYRKIQVKWTIAKLWGVIF